ncbi:MAG TPA: hypothetical protein VLC09_02880 [Polyangiaceae bacterium]|nr:hypothetical protein [Polyangiaceae bacterium]
MPPVEPATFEYGPLAAASSSSAVVTFRLIVLPVAVTSFVAMGAPDWALPSGAATAALLWWLRRRAQRIPDARFRVEEDQLEVHDGWGKPLFRGELERLHEVRLDTKTVELLQENLSSGIPDLRFVDQRVGPAADHCRVELVTDEGVLLLSQDFRPSIEITDKMNALRRFLRKQGWKPLNERDAVEGLPEGSVGRPGE